MKFTSAKQLKDWINNKSKSTGAPANVLLQSYMMERLLERISISKYKDNFILKGGFLIASMIGIDKRTTKDIDTTVKGLSINQHEVERIINEIISVFLEDGASFEITGIANIRETGKYDDFRISLKASIFTIWVHMKLDITIGDSVIPREIEYQYKLLFEDRAIPVMAYNIYTILAEKIETILSRNVANSRGRDFYDTYILLTMHRTTLSRITLRDAIRIKAEERNSYDHIIDASKLLKDISESPEIAKTWAGYARDYPYAENIHLQDIISTISWVFENQPD
ncbi:MAG: nucleotidyl transferase AbiEii/AbiGii toxin family protein [Oscillospiraceae bacterium]|nr:nucleotidyl transferase AbiEii/AbiGii toxin family protein [Oscillospiraceae bacterium]